MNSIRPLVTITILTIVAVFLFMKINEGPVRPVAVGGATTDFATPDGVPPLDVAGAPPAAKSDATATSDSAAPTWPSTTSTAEPIAHAADLAPVNVPAVPEVPELPASSGAYESDDPLAAPAPTSLPENIPVAQYPGESPIAGDDASGPAVPAQSNAATSALDRPPIDPNAHATESAMAAVGLTPGPGTTTSGAEASPTIAPEPQPLSNPVSSAGTIALEEVTPPAASPAAAPTEPSFAASWPVIQTALERGELARAHQLLSQWYGEPSLTAAEKEQVETLLNQLAGTVVYSTEHQLEPAHVVQAGETLESIAAKYNVPWQLLAKINGVASSDAVQPGRPLKVMRGPFSAVVNLGRNEVTLMLDGRYAGKFGISGPISPQLREGEWQVTQKYDGARDGQVVRSLTLEQPGETPVYLGAARVEPPVTSPAGAVVDLSPADANEVSDILSVGSRVVIRR